MLNHELRLVSFQFGVVRELMPKWGVLFGIWLFRARSPVTLVDLIRFWPQRIPLVLREQAAAYGRRREQCLSATPAIVVPSVVPP